MNFLKKILKFEEQWCEYMGYFNPYIDPFETPLSHKVPVFDATAFNQNPNYNYVYDKLWVAKSQNINSGELKNFSGTNFPIFIKPRWGHKTSSSRNCHIINNAKQLKPYMSKPDMMWSDFITEREGMTDFILLHGRIVYQLTYDYLDNVDGFSDKYKYISSDNKPPTIIISWVQKYLPGYTGALNIQYRGDKIIEVSLRLARGGGYILSTENNQLIAGINDVFEKNTWGLDIQVPTFKPYYVFKIFISRPIFYILPQRTLDYIMNKNNCMPFYEYYFEPNGTDKMSICQFCHYDLNTGLKLQKMLEIIFTCLQKIFILLIVIAIIVIYYNWKCGLCLLAIIAVLFLTRFLNPFSVQKALYKAQYLL